MEIEEDISDKNEGKLKLKFIYNNKELIKDKEKEVRALKRNRKEKRKKIREKYNKKIKKNRRNRRRKKELAEEKKQALKDYDEKIQLLTKMNATQYLIYLRKKEIKKKMIARKRRLKKNFRKK